MKIAFWITALFLFINTVGPSKIFAEDIYHELKSGDTLTALARKYNVTADSILALNHISNPNKIRVGQKLLIPTLYTIAQDDTLYGIARAFNVSVDEIRSLNNLKNQDRLLPGKSLILPQGASKNKKVVVATTKSKQSTPQKAIRNSTSERSLTTTVRSDTVKTSVPASEIAQMQWPVNGDVRYISGKLYGVAIRTDGPEIVHSLTAGTVKYAGPYHGFGQVIFVESTDGLLYVYGGNDSISVKLGDTIRYKQEIARLGSNKNTGAQSYFFVYKDKEALDPARAPRG